MIYFFSLLALWFLYKLVSAKYENKLHEQEIEDIGKKYQDK